MPEQKMLKRVTGHEGASGNPDCFTLAHGSADSGLKFYGPSSACGYKYNPNRSYTHVICVL